MIHELKTIPKYFAMIVAGSKNFEVRKNDRDFKIGDELILKEYDNNKSLSYYSSDRYTGRILHRRIDYVLHGGQLGIEEGYCVMSLSRL